MNVLFEESGEFHAASIMSQQGEAFQVEMVTGKRAKVKAKDVLLQFASPSPQEVMEQGRKIAGEIDIDFLWEVAGTEEFGFAELGSEYFGHAPLPQEATGLLICLHGAPVYFYRKGRGRYKAAPEDILKLALAGIEKKKQQALVQAQYVEELKASRLPEAFAPIVWQLLFKPDKNGIEYKALDAACKELQTSPQRLMLATGGVQSAYDLHYQRFLFEFFPKGTHFPPVEIPSVRELPEADVQAFSIDDITTTEIDDALSVTRLPNGHVRIGIHIAAPGLGIEKGSALDDIARKRMSTVYFPGEKITMMPDELVSAFTLDEGKSSPALSLYATLDPADWQVIDVQSKVERLTVAKNLRLNELDDIVTDEAMAQGTGDYPFKEDISLLWQWAQHLERGRMQKRESFGLRAEQTNRVDFSFYVDEGVVRIVRRKRGAPLDKIVAELMIFANSTWGKLMADHGVPGIYRAQGGNGGWAARMQVRMVTHPAPHQGLGVDQYAWSTSPLRRYTDLVNQWQIIACLDHGVTAPLAAPFKPKDADLFAIVSAFDAAYGGYAEFQTEMERYWCLRWLAQEQAKLVDAVVLKDEILRLQEIPLVIRMPGMTTIARGSHVKLDIIRWDEVSLDVEARVLDVATGQVAEVLDDEEETAGDAGEDNRSEQAPPAQE